MGFFLCTHDPVTLTSTLSPVLMLLLVLLLTLSLLSDCICVVACVSSPLPPRVLPPTTRYLPPKSPFLIDLFP